MIPILAINDYLITLQHTIEIDDEVFTAIKNFYLNIKNFAGQPGLINELGNDMYVSITANVQHIATYVIRFSEVSLSHHPNDLLLTLDQLEEKYHNMVKLHNVTEKTFEQVQIIYMEENPDIANLNIVSLEKALDRLRLASNTLVRAIRLMEATIRDNNPNFEFLEKKWFED